MLTLSGTRVALGIERAELVSVDTGLVIRGAVVAGPRILIVVDTPSSIGRLVHCVLSFGFCARPSRVCEFSAHGAIKQRIISADFEESSFEESSRELGLVNSL